VLNYLEAEIIIRFHFSRWRMVNFERFDSLAEIGGVSANVDYVANAQRPARF
jgi:hypothetical protein